MNKDGARRTVGSRPGPPPVGAAKDGSRNQTSGTQGGRCPEDGPEGKAETSRVQNSVGRIKDTILSVTKVTRTRSPAPDLEISHLQSEIVPCYS
jgi:hypothetical protein